MIWDPVLDSRPRLHGGKLSGNDRKDFIKAVILAAGFGTRMGDLTKDTPKPLLKYQGKTLLEHNLEAMPNAIDEVIIVVGYLGEQIRATVGDSFNGKKIVYVEQRELNGTAGAMNQCKDLIEQYSKSGDESEQKKRDRFLVIMGDDIYKKEDLENLRDSEGPLAVLVYEVKDDDLMGQRHALIRTDREGSAVEILERQPATKGTLVNTGAYKLTPDYFRYQMLKAGNETEEFGLPQTFLQMVKDGAKFTPVKATYWKKVSTPEDLK